MPRDRHEPTTDELELAEIDAATAQPVTAGSAAGSQIDDPSPAEAGTTPLRRVSSGWLALSSIANFGVSMAFIVPLSFSLAVRISDLAPGHEEVLGYVTGIAQIVYLIASPLIGVWSDRLQSRFGRRSPFMLGGALLGIIGLLVIASAPSVLVIGVGWIVGLMGWATAGQAIQNRQAETVPEEQRGRISALTGLLAQVAPVIGIGIAYAVSSSTLLVFIVPGIVGLICVLLFTVLKKEGSSATIARASAVSVKTVLSSYVFNPRKHPDFGWNWLGRFLFFMGLYFNTSFGAFFYAQRLDLPVKEVAGTVSIIGLIGIVAATAGALGAGFLSDKLRRRKLFALIGAVLFVLGAVTEAFAYSFVTLLIGSLIMQLAIAAFSAVDQAIVFAVIPDRAQTGRYLAVVAFAQKIPSGIAPLIAPFIITIGAVGADKNYTALYLAGAVLALIGGLVVVSKVKGVR
ncbi:MFS transporter [Herbiconiux ginsengi]|uniref:MFS-type transporter involved in bile tolerance, Atg22 family n=1 Tax=Herbiconiux ginsengi TaxID=381665 RepID=A0A1H3LPX6_9MICO|nr:MFS transporter [Herbiconiux ginsengi]SDY66149.1 MFS-type transporter involved in bile tolerance, Atg22 family [Herbiconiux ginsengi]